MKDKVILVTGATSGIGKQSAIALATMGARLIITGRNAEAGSAAADEIRSLSGNQHVDLFLADVTSQADIRRLASHVIEKYGRLDVLINNAGMAAPQRILTSDGVETNFAANVVAPFLLTHLLQGALKQVPSARVITLMGGDVPNTLDLNNIQGENNFDGLNSYSQSKLAMMVVMSHYSQKMEGTGITMSCCYPGQASTNMTRGVTPEMLPEKMRWLFPVFRLMTKPDQGRSAKKAASSTIYLASSVNVEKTNGKYFNSKCKETQMPKVAYDATAREYLWSVVHKLTGLTE